MVNKLRVIIAGSRSFTDYKFLESNVSKIINNINNDELSVEIIEGGCEGVYALACKYANDYNHPLMQFDADWERHGKAAGPIRNTEMAKYACEAVQSALIAFISIDAVAIADKSKGTKDMIKKARRKNMDVYLITY